MITIGIILTVVTAYFVSQRETYLSEDPLYGSFRIEPASAGTVYPADFLVSVNVKTDDRTLLNCAEESGIDISKGAGFTALQKTKCSREKSGRERRLLMRGTG